MKTSKKNNPGKSILSASLLCLSLWLTATITWSQSDAPQESDEAQPVTEKVTLTLSDADIRDLIRWANDVTDKNIIIHPNVKGKVSVLAGDPMTPDEAFQVFLSVLQVHGYAAIPSGNSLKIIPDALAKQASVPIAGTGRGSEKASVDLSWANGNEDVVVRIAKIKNVSALQLINLLRPLVPQVGHLAAYPTTNSIIIADRAANIEKILHIIQRIDQVGVVDIELIPLQYASADDVIELINKLLPKPQGKTADPQLINLAADERSNSILLTGDPATRQQIRSLINRLDQPLSGEGNTQVIYLNYAKAADMVPILESVSGSVQKSDKDKAGAEVEVSIQADEALNALVITAPTTLLNTMKGVIGKLDVRRAQVLVEALIVEVNEDLGNSLGIAWRTDSESNTFAGSNTFPSDLTEFTGDTTGILPKGLSLGYFRGGELRAVINALASETNANILSTPTIMALDNEEAQILVGESVPFITGTESREGNTNPFQTVERQDIGVTLKVRPRINKDDSVTLEIEQSVENVLPTDPDLDTADIRTSKREVKTRVLIGDDEILVLGGLIDDTLTEVESKVPLLGDIPLLGRLFKSTSTEIRKNNLMVFIHPIILKDQPSGIAVSRDRYNSVRDDQQAFRRKVESYFVPREMPLLPEFPKDQGSDGGASTQKTDLKKTEVPPRQP